MITIRDWIATIPDTDKHIAYVGEEASVFREFLLTGADWKVYRNWTFYLDMAFDLSSVTKRDSKQVVTTQQDVTETVAENQTENNASTTEPKTNSSEMTGQTQVKTSTNGKKETYTVETVQVNATAKTDVVYLTKQEQEDGLRLRWKVLAQHTQLPGKLTATLRAMGTMGEVKKSALMVFEVDPAVVAEPAVPISRNTFELMLDEMSASIQMGYEYAEQTAKAAADATTAASQAALSATGAQSHAVTAERHQMVCDEMAQAAIQAAETAGAHSQRAEEDAELALAFSNAASASASAATDAATTATTAAADAADAAAAASESAEEAETWAAQARGDASQTRAVTEALVEDITRYGTEGTFCISADAKPLNTVLWRSYVVPVECIAAITRIRLYSTVANYYAVSFYSTTDIDPDSFVGGIRFNTTGAPLELDTLTIPENAVIAVFSNRVESGIGIVEGIAHGFANKLWEKVSDVQKDTDALTQRMTALETTSAAEGAALATLRNEKEIHLLTEEYAYGQRYISSGGLLTSSQYWNSYLVKNAYSSLRFQGYTNSTIYYMVGFYASEIPSDATFLSGIHPAVSGFNNFIIHKEDIPEGTRSILFCTRQASGTGSTLVGVTTTVEALDNVTADVERMEQDVSAIRNVLSEESALRARGKGNVRAIYRDMPNNNDFTLVGDEIWFAQNTDTDTLLHRYRITEDALVPIAKNILTDFGHWNCVDYNAQNDCLVFGNAANDKNTEGNFFSVVPNPRAIDGSATLDTHAIRYPVNIGYKVQAVWGDDNLGKNNVVYLFANDATDVVKVMLKQNEDGTFYKDPNTGCGEFIVLECIEQNVFIGCGGGDYWGHSLYIGDGIYHGYKEMSMYDGSVKSLRRSFYRDDGTKITGSTQGIHVDSDYLWMYYNVAYANQERPNESYLVQYYR